MSLAFFELKERSFGYPQDDDYEGKHKLAILQPFLNYNPLLRTRIGIVAFRRRKHSNFCKHVQKPLPKTKAVRYFIGPFSVALKVWID